MNGLSVPKKRNQNKETKWGGKIDITQAIKYRYANGLSYQDIADKMGVTKQAVEQRLSKVIRLIGDAEDNNAYDNNRQHFLTGIERSLSGLLVDREKQKKATLGNVAYAMDKVNNILRLERGQSTQNQAVQVQIVRFSEAENIPEVDQKRGKSAND